MLSAPDKKDACVVPLAGRDYFFVLLSSAQLAVFVCVGETVVYSVTRQLVRSEVVRVGHCCQEEDGWESIINMRDERRETE